MRRPAASKKTLIITVCVTAVVVAALCLVGIFVLAGGSSKHVVPPVPGHDGAASWTQPWHPGNPQAQAYGRAFQILDKQHPPAHASEIYWLGLGSGKLYPYVRAMKGNGAEVMLSTVIYADKESADFSHLVITSWSTKPFPTGQQSEGGKLMAQFNRGVKRTSGGYSWVDANIPSKGWQALVRINAHTVLQVIRLDGFAPPLSKMIAKLRPYPQP